MKRISTLIVCMLFLLSCAALAADDSRSYRFELTINGKNEIDARAGDILTVTVTLHRTDSGEPAEIYAMQDEIRYNAAFLELVEGSAVMSGGIETNDISLQGDERCFYVNYVSFAGGDVWENDKILGTFQMRVLSDSGAATLVNENCRVSRPDGSDSYVVAAQDATVIVSRDCTVTFDPQNGEEPAVHTVMLGETLAEPAEPVWDGHRFNGWFRDKALSERWDFENDTVQGSMTLYGGWLEGGEPDEGAAGNAEIMRIGRASVCVYCIMLAALVIQLLCVILRRRTVRFDSRGGSPVRAIKIWKGRTVNRPADPHKRGMTFGGWYLDRGCTRAWDFAKDRVEKSVTLYARWDEK